MTDPIALNQLQRLTENASMYSRQFFQQLMDPRRDIDAECGYPSSGLAIGPEIYKQLYDREGAATTVVEVLPKESWQVTPEVYEDASSEEDTPFEQAWHELEVGFQSGTSFHQTDDGSTVWSQLQRLDILSGIGHFGAGLFGFDDGKPLDQPVDGSIVANEGPFRQSEVEYMRKLKVPEKHIEQLVSNAAAVQTSSGPLLGADEQYYGVWTGQSEEMVDKPLKPGRKLLFFRPFDEPLVQIVRYEWNVRNPRFGMPVMYRITLNDPRELHSGIGLPLASVYVHWSRVLHVADNLRNSEIFGVPRMRPVLNRLLDIRKLYGAGAEGYWRSCFNILSFETHPQLGGDVIVDRPEMKDMLEQLHSGLDKDLITSGMSVKSIGPSVVDPSSQIDKQLEAICIQLRMPMRVFKGSERGELASSQDDAAWNDRLRNRQHTYLTPRIIVPFLDRLILLGVLPQPGDKGAQKALQQARQNKQPIRNVRGGFVVHDANGKPSLFVRKGGYSVKWPDLDSLSDTDKATIANTTVTAMSAYVQGGVEAICPVKTFYTKVLKWDEDDAKAVVEDAQAAHEDMDTMTMPPQVEGQPAKAPPGSQAHADAKQQADAQKQAADAATKAPQPPVVVPPGGKAVHPADVKPTDNQFCPTGAGGGQDNSCGRLAAAGKAVYDRLPKPLQKIVDAAMAVEHKLESVYKSTQKLAVAVAKEHGLSDKHVEKVGRLLAAADTIGRWGPNIPALHGGLEVVTHAALGALGGPVSFVAAKAAFYVPVASLGYIAVATSISTAKELIGLTKHRDPFHMIKKARERVRQEAAAQPTHNVATKSDAKTLLNAFMQVPEARHDEFYTLLSAAVDETRGDVKRATTIALNLLAEPEEVGAEDLLDNASPDQQRDEHGRWAASGNVVSTQGNQRNVNVDGKLTAVVENPTAEGLKNWLNTMPKGRSASEFGTPYQSLHGMMHDGDALVWDKYENADRKAEMDRGNPDEESNRTVHHDDMAEALKLGEVPFENRFFVGFDAKGRVEIQTYEGKESADKSLLKWARKSKLVVNYNPDQPRDEHGRWSDGGSGAAVAKEKSTAPPPGKHYNPDVEKDHNGDGVTDAARVGVPAHSLPPPPPIQPLPNLTPHERRIEKGFLDAFNKDPDKLTDDFHSIVKQSTKPGEPPVFGTDDAKVLTDAWSHPNPEVRAENRATLNTPLHQVANAIAKRAFVKELDSLKPGDEVMVTVGGCGAGKGYALKAKNDDGTPKVPQALEMKQRCKAVWDSAGDQNATENPWIQKECEARGLKANYMYMQADPYKQWADPERGVVKRAEDPADGRMVDSRVFADSYALGAKNHQAFYESHKDNPNAKFLFVDGRQGLKTTDSVPKDMQNIDREHLAKYADKVVHEGQASPRVRRGALIGQRIWGGAA